MVNTSQVEQSYFDAPSPIWTQRLPIVLIVAFPVYQPATHCLASLRWRYMIRIRRPPTGAAEFCISHSLMLHRSWRPGYAVIPGFSAPQSSRSPKVARVIDRQVSLGGSTSTYSSALWPATSCTWSSSHESLGFGAISQVPSSKSLSPCIGSFLSLAVASRLPKQSDSPITSSPSYSKPSSIEPCARVPAQPLHYLRKWQPHSTHVLFHGMERFLGYLIVSVKVFYLSCYT